MEISDCHSWPTCNITMSDPVLTEQLSFVKWYVTAVLKLKKHAVLLLLMCIYLTLLVIAYCAVQHLDHHNTITEFKNLKI